MRVDFAHDSGRSARRDPSNRLIAALSHLTGGTGALLRHQQRPWASITFSGTRHRMTYVFCGHDAVAAGEAFIAALPEHEFSIPRQIVADIEITSVDHVLMPQPCITVDFELLLLEES